ncbi:MAG: hypothetical protein EB060_01005 [Proteobacteria bacterium]|nr:hypothetical protein [Pseudomonadota bacterium]
MAKKRREDHLDTADFWGQVRQQFDGVIAFKAEEGDAMMLFFPGNELHRSSKDHRNMALRKLETIKGRRLRTETIQNDEEADDQPLRTQEMGDFDIEDFTLNPDLTIELQLGNRAGSLNIIYGVQIGSELPDKQATATLLDFMHRRGIEIEAIIANPFEIETIREVMQEYMEFRRSGGVDFEMPQRIDVVEEEVSGGAARRTRRRKRSAKEESGYPELGQIAEDVESRAFIAHLPEEYGGTSLFLPVGKRSDDQIDKAAYDILGHALGMRMSHHPGTPKGWDDADVFPCLNEYDPLVEGYRQYPVTGPVKQGVSSLIELYNIRLAGKVTDDDGSLRMSLLEREGRMVRSLRKPPATDAGEIPPDAKPPVSSAQRVHTNGKHTLSHAPDPNRLSFSEALKNPDLYKRDEIEDTYLRRVRKRAFIVRLPLEQGGLSVFFPADLESVARDVLAFAWGLPDREGLKKIHEHPPLMSGFIQFPVQATNREIEQQLADSHHSFNPLGPTETIRRKMQSRHDIEQAMILSLGTHYDIRLLADGAEVPINELKRVERETPVIQGPDPRRR